MRWGRRRASSVRMDSGMRVGDTSNMGLPETPATGAPERASLKTSPEAMKATRTPGAKDAREIAAEVS